MAFGSLGGGGRIYTDEVDLIDEVDADSAGLKNREPGTGILRIWSC
jgi:hypothetical protein